MFGRLTTSKFLHQVELLFTVCGPWSNGTVMKHVFFQVERSFFHPSLVKLKVCLPKAFFACLFSYVKFKPPKKLTWLGKSAIEDVFPIEKKTGGFSPSTGGWHLKMGCFAGSLLGVPNRVLGFTWVFRGPVMPTGWNGGTLFDTISTDFRSGTAKMADFGLSGIAKNKALVFFFLPPRLWSRCLS